ncbi:beta-ketoacyl synthase N-terminal-like domain-containing protein [Micromonospora tarensis]|nr:beta-ketoacyl synthase N-terminal-like domain-containing protein [Micromonospora tarensis]
MSTVNPVISAWSAVSPYGIGRAAFAAGLRSGRPSAQPLDPAQWQVPDETACLVPDFDIREVLGKKGTRSMDRVSALAVATVGELLAEAGDAAPPPAGTGLVLGTTTGSAQSLMDFSRDSFTQAKPYFVDAARFPNAVMNCASGQCAIWHGLKGPNATVAGGRVAGLFALNYARRLLRAGRADAVLSGAVEEYSPARSWLDHHGRGDDETATVLGEGCGVLLLTSTAAAAGSLAEVLAVEFGTAPDSDYRQSLESCVRRALRRAGLDLADVWAVAPGGGDAERGLLDSLLPDDRVRRIDCAGLLGDAAAAAATFQILAVLSLADDGPAGRVVLVTANDRSGLVGCALLRLP